MLKMLCMYFTLRLLFDLEIALRLPAPAECPPSDVIEEIEDELREPFPEPELAA